MPTYQYACTECGHGFEQVQTFSEDSLTVCPQCQGRLRKVYNAVGVVFKGSGFYRTDSRSGSGESGGSSESGSSSDGGTKESGSKDSGSKDAGSSSGSSDSGAASKTTSPDSGAGSKTSSTPTTTKASTPS